jgi:hypothetical protein
MSAGFSGSSMCSHAVSTGLIRSEVMLTSRGPSILGRPFICELC